MGSGTEKIKNYLPKFLPKITLYSQLFSAIIKKEMSMVKFLPFLEKFLLINAVIFPLTLFAADEIESIEERISEKEAFRKDVLSGIISDEFQKTLEKIEQEKQEKIEALTARVGSVVDAWFGGQRGERESKINRKIGQDWAKFSNVYKVTFYLRDFNYSQTVSDIKETGSLVYPYEAVILVQEALYVEKAPLAAQPRSKYQYCAITDIKLNLQYRKDTDKWEIVDIYRGDVDLQLGWPPAVRKKLTDYFIARD